MTKKYEICLRLNEAERQKLEQDTTLSGLSKTDYIRSLIVGAEIKPRRPAELRELYLAVNRIGVNINQIARKANAGFATRSDMQELKFLMRKIENHMSRIAEG